MYFVSFLVCINVCGVCVCMCMYVCVCTLFNAGNVTLKQSIDLLMRIEPPSF